MMGERKSGGSEKDAAIRTSLDWVIRAVRGRDGMFRLDGDFILRIAPRFSGEKAERQRRIVDEIAPVFAATLEDFDILSRLRISHFMAQVTHECAGFRTTEEFASGEAYELRKDLGNTQAGDGPRFKGRGLIQLTGRANYRRYGQLLGLPLEDEPEIAKDPVTSLQIACTYWRERHINEPADADDLVRVTKRVNGGTNGLSERSEYLRKAKALLASMASEALAARPFLHRGSEGHAVGELQRLLRHQGFLLAVDNEFGAATELAVKTFQQRAGLSPEGIANPATWNSLLG